MDTDPGEDEKAKVYHIFKGVKFVPLGTKIDDTTLGSTKLHLQLKSG